MIEQSSLPANVAIILLQEVNARHSGRSVKGLSQRAALNLESTNEVPRIACDLLRSPSQPLDEATCSFRGVRFEGESSNTFVHINTKAALTRAKGSGISNTI